MIKQDESEHEEREIQEELDTKIKVGSLIDTLKQSKLITPEKEV